MIKFNKRPVCEVCKKNEATRFILTLGVRIMGIDRESDWKFVCERCDDCSPGLCDISYCFEDPARMIDTLARVKGYEPSKFIDMMFRFRTATHSFDRGSCYCIDFPGMGETQDCNDCKHPLRGEND